MRDGRRKRIILYSAVVLLLCLTTVMTGSMADGVISAMPAFLDKQVYWQLGSVRQEQSATPFGGYTVDYEATGFSLDLSDPLMAESILKSEDAPVPMIRVSIEKGGSRMEHLYTWTAPPVFLMMDTDYTIDISGTVVSEPGGQTPNTLLTGIFQGSQRMRASAGQYNGYPTAGTLTFTTSNGLYKNGGIEVSILLEDRDNMFHIKTTYRYEMANGVKPEPTPIPGFVAMPLPIEGQYIPDFYVQAEGQSDLFQIITAPSEYRAYGSMSGSEPMFFPADAQGRVAMNESPASEDSDFARFVQGFVAVEPDVAPPFYTILESGAYAFTARDGQVVTRAYGRVDGEEAAFYPYDVSSMQVTIEEGPVDPQTDYAKYIEGFGPSTAQEPFPYYTIIEPGLYAFTGRDGVMRYRAYGRLDGAEPTYYASTEAGEVDGTVVVPAEDFEQYIKGFDPLAPGETPSFYTEEGLGLFSLLDHDATRIFRAYGVLDGMPPAFYPADETGNLLEGAAAVMPEMDFEAYIAGFVSAKSDALPEFYQETDLPGVYRFTSEDGLPNYRVYGALNRGEPAFYPADETGAVLIDALPADPAADLASLPAPVFTPLAADTPPAFYEPVAGPEGLYQVADREGVPQYRAYGSFDGGAASFYPADETGNPVAHAAPADPAADFAGYVEGFAAMEPETIPAQYVPVDGAVGFFTYNAPGDPLYRVYGSLNRETPQFFLSDAEGSPLSPIDPAEDIVVIPTPYATEIIYPPADSLYANQDGVAKPPEVLTSQAPIQRAVPTEAVLEIVPTPYATNIIDAAGLETTSPQAITRDIPAATVISAAPTPYATFVGGENTLTTSSPGTISREVETQPEPTFYMTDIVPMATPGGAVAPVVRTVAAQSAQTDETTPAPDDAQTTSPTGESTTQAISRAVVNPVNADVTGTPTADSETSSPALSTAETSSPAAEAVASPSAPAEGTTEQPSEAPPQGEPTPDASEAPVVTPEVASSEGAGLPGGVIAAIIGGLALLGGGAYLFSRRKKS